MPQSVGMIGGKPSQALYFIGYTGNENYNVILTIIVRFLYLRNHIKTASFN